MEAHGIYFSLSSVLRKGTAAGWESCSLCFLLLCTFSGSSLLGFCLFFLMFNKKAVSAAMLRLFLSLSLSASVSVLGAVPWSAVWCSRCSELKSAAVSGDVEAACSVLSRKS